MAQRSRVLGLATLALGCLVGRGAAKPPDLPADAPVVAAPQLAPTDGPVPNRWLDPDPVFRPQPAPAAPAQARFLGPIATASLLHTVHPLLALLPRERGAATPRPERLPMPREVPAECPYHAAATDRPAVTADGGPAVRSVSENLAALRQAGAALRRAEALARDGQVADALESLEQARGVCPGSNLDHRAAELIRDLAARPQEAGAEEQEATPPTDGLGWLHGVEQFGLCWAQQATETVCRIAAVEHPVAAADGSRVDRLMRACYRAVDEGHHARAAALARRAHRLDPVRVEGDPLVYKLDLLGGR